MKSLLAVVLVAFLGQNATAQTKKVDWSDRFDALEARVAAIENKLTGPTVAPAPKAVAVTATTAGATCPCETCNCTDCKCGPVMAGCSGPVLVNTKGEKLQLHTDGAYRVVGKVANFVAAATPVTFTQDFAPRQFAAPTAAVPITFQNFAIPMQSGCANGKCGIATRR